MIQTLISSGHKLEDIKNYNFTQIGAFLKSIYKMKNDDSILNMQFMRAAFVADDKSFKKITSSADSKPEKDFVPEGWITRK